MDMADDIFRMFVISRGRVHTEDKLEENVDMVGSVGNIYKVTISHEPKCTCPDSRKGNLCKHIIYVWLPILLIIYFLC